MKICRFSIMTMDAGAVAEALDMALQTVWEDVCDENKDSDASRKVVLTITVTPPNDDKRRLQPIVDARVKTTLAPYRNISDTAYLEHGADGLEAHAVDPEQPKLDFEAPLAAVKA